MECICCKKYEDAENIKQILTEERELSDINFQRIETALAYKRKLQTENGKLLLSVDSLITINNIILNANNLELRKHVRPAGSKKAYMDFFTILPALTGLIDTFNAGKLRPKTFVETFLKIHPFADRNGRTCKVLFI